MEDTIFQGYDYRIASLRVRSFMPLPALPACFDDPDVLISRGRVPERLENPLAGSDWWQIGKELTMLVVLAGRFKILIEDGKRIVVDTESSLPDEGTLSFLMGPAFSAVLVHRTRLAFHGSAIAFGNRCALFIGERGAGKSTMAGYFRLKGYPNLGDDLCAISWDGGIPGVAPIFPWIKLREDAARFFRSGMGEGAMARHGQGRFAICPDTGLDSRPRRLVEIFLLDKDGEIHDGQAGLFVSLTRNQGFSWLYRNLYGAHLARHLGVFSHLVEQMVKVSGIPMSSCPRISGLKKMERQVDMIIERMKAHEV